MTPPSEYCGPTVRYLPGRGTVALTVAGSALAWLLALGALAGTVGDPPGSGWLDATFPVLLCGSLPAALWLTWRVRELSRISRKVPATLLEQRRYGDLSAITDTDRRPLRPIGTTAVDVATRTEALLGDLTAIPSVRIFRGVRPAGTNLPLTSHAISAGRLLILVESVAWPPGRYRTDASGKVRCDGQYIGQSVRPLVVAVRRTRRLLPRSHRVSALVVVHGTGHGTYVLPAPGTELTWSLADDAAGRLRDRIDRHALTVSRHTLAALTAAEPARVATP
jgi:hypothetical protein